MSEYNNFIDDLIYEWSYRTKNGIVDMTNEYHIYILKNILEEKGFGFDDINDMVGAMRQLNEGPSLSSITTTGTVDTMDGHSHESGSQPINKSLMVRAFISPNSPKSMEEPIPYAGDVPEDEDEDDEDEKTDESVLGSSSGSIEVGDGFSNNVDFSADPDDEPEVEDDELDEIAIYKYNPDTDILENFDDVLVENVKLKTNSPVIPMCNIIVEGKKIINEDRFIETICGMFVREEDMITESGILDTSKIGNGVTDLSSKKNYTLVSNDFHKNIASKTKNLKNLITFGKETDSGYLIVLEDEKGKTHNIVKYAKKKLTSKVLPKLVGLTWQKSSESLNIKPQNMIKSLLDKEVTAQEIISTTKNTIDKMNEPSGLKQYLSDLLDFSYTGKNPKPILEYGDLNKSTFAQIEKNYGEILGALWVLAKEGGKVLFPGRGNYPLIDFLLMTTDSTIKYSSKGGSSSSTNTISTKDILKIIDSKKEFDVFRSGKYKDVYDIMKVIKEASIIEGPTKLADFFKVKYDDDVNDDRDKWSDLSYKMEKRINVDKYIKPLNEITNSILTVDYLITVLMKHPAKPNFVIKPGKEIKVSFRDKRDRRNKIGLNIKK